MLDSVAQPLTREQREYVMSASDSVVQHIRDADPHEARQANDGIYAIVAKNRVNTWKPVNQTLSFRISSLCCGHDECNLYDRYSDTGTAVSDLLFQQAQ